MRVVGFGLLVDEKAHTGEEAGCGLEVPEFIFLYFVLDEELRELIVLFQLGQVEFRLGIDVGGDPVAAAALEDGVDDAAETLFFRFVQVDEEAFVNVKMLYTSIKQLYA